jgi:hypothetical protein
MQRYSIRPDVSDYHGATLKGVKQEHGANLLASPSLANREVIYIYKGHKITGIVAGSYKEPFDEF